MLGLLARWACLAFLLTVVLNPGGDRESREICEAFFSASHLVLAVCVGYGINLLGLLLAAPSAAVESERQESGHNVSQWMFVPATNRSDRFRKHRLELDATCSRDAPENQFSFFVLATSDLMSAIIADRRRPYSTKFLRISLSLDLEPASWKTTTMCGSIEMPSS